MRQENRAIDSQQGHAPNTTWQQQEVIDYYRAAGADYSAWSKNLHMHLGFYRKHMNPFSREQMLDEMPRQLFQRLKLNSQSCGTVMDLGCGVGASLRIGTQLYPQLSWKGVTIVPEQQACCASISQETREYSRILVTLDDYERLLLPDESLEYVYALESMSHARGGNKEGLISEMYRVLKPGGRFAIADGFLLRAPEELSVFLNYCHRELCRGWALPILSVLPLVLTTLEEKGFENLEAEDISWNVAPSVAHIPWVSLRFMLERFLARDKLKTLRKNHLKSCILTGITGLARSSFSYCMLSGQKPVNR